MEYGLIGIEDQNIPTCLNEYINYLDIICGNSKDTATGYKADLVVFFRFLNLYRGVVGKDSDFDKIKINNIDNAFLSTVTLKDLYYFLAFVERNRKNSNFARARKVASLKSFFKFMHKTKALTENPTLELETPKISKRNPVYLTLEECQNLLKAIGGRYKDRDVCMFMLFLNCGLRLSELCGINVSSIKGDLLTVVGKGDKDRTIYLNEACLEAVKNCLGERAKVKGKIIDKDALFISKNFRRINKRSVEKLFKKHLDAANLDINKYSPHKLRHTAATLMYKYGNVDIRSLQDILGHKNISTTQIYTHLDDNKLRAAARSNPLNIKI